MACCPLPLNESFAQVRNEECLETSNGNPALHETFRNRLVYNQRFLKMSVVTLLLSPSLGRGDGLLIPLLPPSSGRRWRVAPEVGFALFRLRPTPCPSGISLPREGGRWATHPASPSFLWKEVARSAGGWLRSLSPSANPLPFGHLPSTGRG